MKFYTNFCQIGPNLAVRYVENGIRKQDKFKINPRLFVKIDSNSDWKSLNEESVKQIDFDSVYDAREFVQKYKNAEGIEILGNTNFKYPEIHKLFGGEYDCDLIRCFDIDIEVDAIKMPKVETAGDPISAITIIINKKDIHVFGYSDIDQNKIESELDRKFEYHKFPDEISMLRGFVTFWTIDHPDVITGWNSTGFDLPYLINRITNVLSETTSKKLSPWGRFRQEWVTSKYGKEQLTYVIDGIESLDYLELYRKHTFITRENYKLNTIAKIELKEQKLEYEGSLHELFVNDPTRYFAYNIKDVILVDKLDDKLGLLNIVYSIAYFANENYSDTFSPVKTWDNIICNYLWDRKICVPLSKIKDRESYEGAFVKQPLHSKIGWGASFDISSAYPNTIRTWNIGPETRLKESELDDSLLEIKNYISSRSIDDLRKCTLSKEYQRILKDRSVCVSLTGEFYSVKKKGILASLVADLYDERTRNKNLAKELKKVDPVSNKKQIDILNTKQKVQKILLNSLYGATANPAFRFFQIENARSITLTVQYLVQHMGDSINAYLNALLNTDTDYVQYIDTDSNYFSLGALLDKYGDDSSDDRTTTFIDKFCARKIEPIIKKTFTETTESFGCPENTITASRETIFKSGVWKTKKLYAVAATDVEGERYSIPEIKVTGLEIVKSSTPEICRKALEECVRICLLEDESTLKSFVKSFKDKYNKFSISEIAFPRGISDLQTYAPIDGKLLWAKKTPSHVKAAHVFNYLLKLHQIDNIPTINDGAKIKFVCLKTPNKFNSNVFGWEDKLPKEFDIEKWVDYDTQYEKSFLKPLTDILAVLGWDSEDRSTLDAFFG